MCQSNSSFTIVYNEPMAVIRNPNAQLVFHWLCTFRNSLNGLCCPSLTKLSECTCLSKNSVLRAIKYLGDTEVIHKVESNGINNKYAIIDKKNKEFKLDRCPTETGATQAPTGTTQAPVLEVYNNINNNITTSPLPPSEDFFSCEGNVAEKISILEAELKQMLEEKTKAGYEIDESVNWAFKCDLSNDKCWELG